MSHVESQYLLHLERLTQAPLKEDRTGTGTRSIFGHQIRHNFRAAGGFPLLTTKNVHLKSIIHELLWFISGDTNIHYLKENGVRIWDEWADEEGDLGPVYGAQWRSWTNYAGNDIDQLQQAIDTLRINPDSRRIIVNAWNVGEIDQMALPPCHMMFQLYSQVIDDSGKRGLSLHMYQRSADWFLGVPFNIASYGLLLQMIAHVVGMVPQDLVISYGDTHLYENHIEQAHTQLGRSMRKLPTMMIDRAVSQRGEVYRHIKGIDDFRYDDFRLIDYNPHPAIKAPVAV